MMRISHKMLLALAGVLMAACSADVADTGGHLRAVDEDAMTSQLLYMVPEASVYPMTEAALIDQGLDVAEAIPVRVEIFDEVAVAWFAPDGVPVISQDAIVALWQVVDRVPVEGAVAPDDRPEVVGSTPYIQLDVNIETESAEIAEQTPVGHEGARAAILDFFDRVGTPEEWWMLGVLQGHHPGC